MTQNFMDYKDPRKVLPLLKLGKEVRRHVDNPIIQDAKTDEERKALARALEFHEQRTRERDALADEVAKEEAELAKHGPLYRGAYRSFWATFMFFFAIVPDVASEAVDVARDFFKKRKR